MKSNYKDLFDRYYFEKMSDVEITQFKQQVKGDPELKKAFKKYQLKAKLSMLEDPEKVVTKIRKEKEETGFFKESKKEPLNGSVITKLEPPKLSKVIPFYKKTWFKSIAIAASVLLIFSLGFFSQSINYDEMYASNDTMETNKKRAYEMAVNMPRGIAGEDDLRLLYKAFLLFGEGDPNGSLEILNSLDETKFAPQINEFYFTKGENYRALSEFEEALIAYQKINDESDLHNYKYMSLFLTYIKLKKEKEAIKSANKVLNSKDTTFQNQASKMLKEF